LAPEPIRTSSTHASSSSAKAEPAEQAPVDVEGVWRALVTELKAQKKDLLAAALAHGRVISIAQGRVRLGFAPQEGMYRRQGERMQKDAEAALSKVLGTPTGITFEESSQTERSAPSLAEQESERLRMREERILRESRESPAVRAALRVFSGTLEHIRVLDEQEEEGFTDTPDEGEDAEA